MPWTLPKDLHSKIGPGPTCFFADHSIGSKDSLVPRYLDSHACIRCVSSLSEGRLTLDVHRIHKSHRRKFLEFWSFVELDDPEECWNWHGTQSQTWSTHQFAIKRHWNFSGRFSPSRVATWFSWGDIGRLPIRTLCRNPRCCNPLHMRVRGVPHFFNNRRLEYVDLEFSSHKLMHDTQLFLETTKEKDPRSWAKLKRANEPWIAYRMQQDHPLTADEIRDIRLPGSGGDDDFDESMIDEFDDPLL